MFFRQKIQFLGRFPPVEVKIAVFWTYILGIWLYFGCLNLYFRCLNLYFWCLNLYRLFWVSELIFWVSELILWVSELVSLVLGVWTHTLGIRGPSILRTRESGNTEGPSTLVWPVNLEILKDQAFWYDLWIWKYWRIGTCGLPAHLDHELGAFGIPDHLGRDLPLGG